MNGFTPIEAPPPQNRAQPRQTGGARIEFLPASALGSGDSIEWLWHGWIARRYVTLLVGLWKAGKSTLLAHLLHATAHGGDVAGEIDPCRVLVISEEGAGLWARRRDDVDIEDNVSFAIRPFKGRPSRHAWEAFIDQIASNVEAGRFDVVVVDTLSTVTPCADENDSSKMMAALTPLHRITEAGAALVLIHHPRKGDAGEGQASRGSGALPGFVDLIIELRRFDAQQADDRRRVLKGLGRFDETPSEVVIELTETGYRTVGSRAQATRAERQETIESILTAEPATSEEIRERWPDDGSPQPGKRAIQTDLANGFEARRWQRVGAGVKGDPHRYYCSEFDSRTVQPLGTNTNVDT